MAKNIAAAQTNIDLLERCHRQPGIHSRGNVCMGARRIAILRRKVFDRREAPATTVDAQELAVQRGKEPRLRLGGIAQGVAFRGPEEKSLLREIGGVAADLARLGAKR